MDKKWTEDQTADSLSSAGGVHEDRDATQLQGVTDMAGKSGPPKMFRPVLICLSGPLRGQRKSITAPDTIIGRSSSYRDDDIGEISHGK